MVRYKKSQQYFNRSLFYLEIKQCLDAIATDMTRRTRTLVRMRVLPNFRLN